MPDTFALTLELPEDGAEPAEALLYEAECLGIEVRDASLKPMPNQRVPRAGHVIMVAHFEERAVAEAAAQSVTEEIAGTTSEIAVVPEQDWSEKWKDLVRAVTAGRLWVGPPWLAKDAAADAVKIVIEPGMAFGTGDHPTTLFCLESVDRAMRERPGAAVLDVGTGSGVLAIAARKLGAGRVVGTDNDAKAIEVAKENAELNHAPDLELSTRTLGKVKGTFDVVLANIVANVLVELAPLIAGKLAPGGRVYLAGVLAEQLDEVSQAYLAQALTSAHRETRGEWAMLAFERAP